MRALRLIVRRSIFKVWLLGVLGLPLIFIAVDYIWGTFGFLDLFASWSYGSKEVEAFEPRDDVLVAILGSLGVACTGFTIKEVVAPRRLLMADDDGIHVPLRGPLRGPDGISWYQVKELRAEDDALLIEVQSRGDLPDDPWGARWVEERVLRIPSSWWDRTPESSIGRIQTLGFRPLIAPAPVADASLRTAIDEAHAAGVQLGAGVDAAEAPDPFGAEAAPPIEPEFVVEEPSAPTPEPEPQPEPRPDPEPEPEPDDGFERALEQLLDPDEDD